jgi:Molybdopterin oxidoreductase
MIVLWGTNIASQPNTARHIISARRRGAKVVTIDVRRTEAAAQSDEVLLIRPGTDAAPRWRSWTSSSRKGSMTLHLSDLTLPASRNCRGTFSPLLPIGAQKRRARRRSDHLFRQGVCFDATGHDPARRQFHAQGCQWLARGARDQLPAWVDRRFWASGRWTWPTSWCAERSFPEPDCA